MKTVEVPTLKPTIRQMILDALKLAYVSVSGTDGIKTGNHYQSVTLGDHHTKGFRSDRQTFLDQVDFGGKRVLDLGSNLGEMSREARARGAALVDGYEVDPFFVEVANAANAYNGTTRVSFYERDITDSAVYSERYDIVLGLSVYIYLQSVLDAVADATQGILVLETHRLEGNLESTYLEPIGRHFPYHMFLGASDWGNGLDGNAQRAVIAFAKTEDALRSHIRGIGAPSRPLSVDRRKGTRPDIRQVDVRRTPWYDRFFTHFVPKSASELIATIAAMELDVDSLAREQDFIAYGMGGWAYWLTYVKGAVQYTETGKVGPGNVYYDLLAEHWNKDVGRVADQSDPDLLTSLVRRRFLDFELFRNNPEAPLQTAPLGIVIPNGPASPSATGDVKRIYEFGSQVPVETTTIDGYHRLFVARFFGHIQLPCDFVAENEALPDPFI